MKNVIKYLLLPVLLAGLFGWLFATKIPTDRLNTDEVIYLKRAQFYELALAGDFSDPAWQSWDSYDQPMLTNYIYGAALTAQTGQDISAYESHGLYFLQSKGRWKIGRSGLGCYLQHTPGYNNKPFKRSTAGFLER